MARVIWEKEGRKLLNLLDEIVNKDKFDEEDAIRGIPAAVLGRIKLFLENHKTCGVNKYSRYAICPIMRLLKDLNQEELCKLLPVLSFLPTSHQEVALSCIGAYASLKTELLQALWTFCTQDGVESQVVSPAIEHVILCYTRHGVGDRELMEFFMHLLTDFSLPPSVAPDGEIGIWRNRYKREIRLANLSDQIGSALVNMPFHAEGLNSLLFIELLRAFQNGGEFDLHKRAAILRVLARGMQEKIFLTNSSIALPDGPDDITSPRNIEWVIVTHSPTRSTWSDDGTPWDYATKVQDDATLWSDDGTPWDYATKVQDDATVVDSLLDEFSHSLRTYLRDIVPLLEEKNKKGKVVQKLLYPLFVILVYSKEVLAKVKEESTSNSLLDLLCKWSENFAEIKDVERQPKWAHISIHYIGRVDELAKEMRRIAAQIGKRKSCS